MRSSKIEKRRQHYLEFIYANQRTIGQINPSVKQVEVDYTIHWFDLPSSEKHHHLTLTPNWSIIVHEWCPNEDCTSNGFELSGVLQTALVQKKTDCAGSMRCDCCPAYLDYTIKIEYIA